MGRTVIVLFVAVVLLSGCAELPPTEAPATPTQTPFPFVTPTPEVWEIRCPVTVAVASGLNVRAEPAPTARIKGALKVGAEVILTDIQFMQENSAGRLWGFFRTVGLDGWIALGGLSPDTGPLNSEYINPLPTCDYPHF